MGQKGVCTRYPSGGRALNWFSIVLSEWLPQLGFVSSIAMNHESILALLSVFPKAKPEYTSVIWIIRDMGNDTNLIRGASREYLCHVWILDLNIGKLCNLEHQPSTVLGLAHLRLLGLPNILASETAGDWLFIDYGHVLLINHLIQASNTGLGSDLDDDLTMTYFRGLLHKWFSLRKSVEPIRSAATLLTGIPNLNPHTAARAVFSKQIWNISSKRHLAWGASYVLRVGQRTFRFCLTA
ncbi:hypothetical protein VNO77_25262 [Canavalia gladiata]|uniref:Uncharacterized protein n=1 Tax=Canavalia gladiata TaxID=3824 RepID=A0AAN9L8E3_CANGL